ncbi:hypothetical protein L873DRAFT_1848887 [Choiromyces venosus 120613-1]|uniref:Uncharacterized protein n=1 Tax=Choiromyces venosus 120613-1 TaxID=1336337 RepID=A0A3N4IWM7_9PEZI|nr:hypothetical protein L873DRAFT_1848887 [Choiromyces venosus 120613-1]
MQRDGMQGRGVRTEPIRHKINPGQRTVTGIEIEHQSSTINGMVVKGAAAELAVTADSPKLDSHYVKGLGVSKSKYDANVKCAVGSQEAMAGEKARLRSQVQDSSGSAEAGPPSRKQWWGSVHPDEVNKGQTKGQQWKQVIHKLIRLMAEHPGFNFVAGFRDAPVTGLSWGQFFDLSPEGKRQFVRLMVQERPRLKGKGLENLVVVMETIAAEEASISESKQSSEVANLYTRAQVQFHHQIYEISHVRIDAGLVGNLAPISVLCSIGALLQPTKDLIICTAASNLVPLEFYTDLEVEVGSVLTTLRVFAMPASCEPAYGLLLSRRWLRQCCAIGDYRRDSYIIKDMSGKEHIVLKEHGRSPGVDRPNISVDPLANLLDLDHTVQAELVLEDEIPLAELLLQIGREAREELESYEEDQSDVGEEDQDDEDDEDESIPGDEEDESGYMDDAKDEHEQGDEDEDDDDMFSIDVGHSDGLDQDPGEPREVKVQGGMEEGRVNCKQESFSHTIDVIVDGDIGKDQSEKSLGAFGTEDVYFYGEVGHWKTARIKELKFRDVPAEEIPRWSKDRVAAQVRKYVEEDREKEMGNQEAAGDSLKEIGLQHRGSVNSNEEKQERKTCGIDDQMDEQVRAGVVEKGNVNDTQNVRTGYGWRFLGFVKDRVFGTWEEPVGSLSTCWARFYEKECGDSHVTGDYQDDGKFWLGVWQRDQEDGKLDEELGEEMIAE